MPPNQTPEAIKEEVDALIKQAEELKGKLSFGQACKRLAKARERQYLFPTQTPFKFARNLGIAIVGWLVALVILSAFDPWYLRRGREYRKMLVPAAPPPTGAAPTASARN
jgi:hypothetical protein